MSSLRGYNIIGRQDYKVVEVLKGTQPRRILDDYRRNGYLVEAVIVKKAKQSAS